MDFEGGGFVFFFFRFLLERGDFLRGFFWFSFLGRGDCGYFKRWMGFMGRVGEEVGEYESGTLVRWRGGEGKKKKKGRGE